MRVHTNQCEAITINGNKEPGIKIFFTDNTEVPQLEIVKYLGCVVNDNGNAREKISKRILECMVILKKLDLCWKHTDEQEETDHL